jgi:hypothetical protein
MTNDTTPSLGDLLMAAIESKDAQQSLAEVHRFKEHMRNVDVGANYVMWITEPVNLTKVHKALAEDLDVPPRLLAIRRTMLNRTQRAVLLVQAIENGIKRVHSL